MQSRMERYYQSDDNVDSKSTRRTLINKDLYEKIYDEVEYTNVEGIASIDKTNEIDINKIKEMLKERENRDVERFKQIVKQPVSVNKNEQYQEEKNYDIRELLNRAKENKEEISKEYRSLRNTQFDILKGVDLKEHQRRKELTEEEDEKVKELFNTITNTSVINKMSEKELPLEILSDLKPTHTETITTDNESIRKIIEAQKEREKKEDKTQVMDKSFYTSSVSFAKDDFEALNINDEKEEISIFVKILVFIMLVIITAGLILGVIMFFK